MCLKCSHLETVSLCQVGRFDIILKQITKLSR